jgi:predicted Rossmann-fold nucleotide-binding protein
VAKPTRRYRRGEVDVREDLRDRLADGHLRGLVVQALDLRDVDLADVDVQGCLFLGCTFSDPAQEADLVTRGASTFARLKGLPYDPYRHVLYSVEDLLEGYDDGGYPATLDFRIYTHFDRERRHPNGVSLHESLAQRLHDHGIDDALEEFLADHSGRGVVGIMGGHGTRRSDPDFLRVAQLAWELTRDGYLIASGGGPGIMEAANLGAYFANYADPAVLEAVIGELSPADTFDGGEEEGTPAYLEAVRTYFRLGQEILSRFRGGEVGARYRREAEAPGISLAIPTWFYGHEPTNLFATHVAKYFSNSLREDGLLAISKGGVVYAPGSAGTMQEVFMDLAQNHYATFKERSPMVFLGRERWEGVFALLTEFVRARRMEAVYGDLLHLTDAPGDAARFIRDHPPRPREEKPPLYELLEG